MFKNKYRKAGLSWLKIKQLKNQGSGGQRSVQLFGHRLFFTTVPELLHGIKEIFVDEVYKQTLPEKPFVIDCGANIGFSVIYIKQHYPAATIIAFEPDDANFKLLEENIRSFGYTDITLNQQAVWNEDTELHFAVTGSMSSRIEKAGGQTRIVKAIRLKNLLTKPVDFLKIDIEGAEYVVLKDIREELSLVQNMFLEYHGFFNQTAELTEMLSWITTAGFSYYIKEAANVYPTPFDRTERKFDYDVQLNIFCFRAG